MPAPVAFGNRFVLALLRSFCIIVVAAAVTVVGCVELFAAATAGDALTHAARMYMLFRRVEAAAVEAAVVASIRDD